MHHSPLALDTLVKHRLRDLEHEAEAQRLRRRARQAPAPRSVSEASTDGAVGQRGPQRLEPHLRLAARFGLKAGA